MWYGQSVIVQEYPYNLKTYIYIYNMSRLLQYLLLSSSPLRSCRRRWSWPPCPGRRWWSLPAWSCWASASAPRCDRGFRCMLGTATCPTWCGGWSRARAIVKLQHMYPRCLGSPSQCKTTEETEGEVNQNKQILVLFLLCHHLMLRLYCKHSWSIWK